MLDAETGIILFVYTAVSDSREVLQDTDEGALEWIPKSKILEIDLVEDLPYLIPRVLEMKDDSLPVHVHVSYDAEDEIQLKFKET